MTALLQPFVALIPLHLQNDMDYLPNGDEIGRKQGCLCTHIQVYKHTDKRARAETSSDAADGGHSSSIRRGTAGYVLRISCSRDFQRAEILCTLANFRGTESSQCRRYRLAGILLR